MKKLLWAQIRRTLKALDKITDKEDIWQIQFILLILLKTFLWDIMANCWKCGRYLGVKDEWKKMKTEKGDICYVCYHEAKESAEEQIQKDMDKIIKKKME